MNRLLAEVLNQYALSIDGCHGVQHWMRVMNTGRMLALKTGADLRVCDLFAIFHDSKRSHEGRDRDHGVRAKKYITKLGKKKLGLNGTQMSDLCAAVLFHADGLVFHPSITVRTCWDMDRLDLGRVGHMPDPKMLCTKPARNGAFIKECYTRSIIEGTW